MLYLLLVMLVLTGCATTKSEYQLGCEDGINVVLPAGQKTDIIRDGTCKELERRRQQEIRMERLGNRGNRN